MSTILAAVMPAPHAPIEVREMPRPDLVPGSALLETIYSEVCGTDVHLWHGRLAGVPYPIIPGPRVGRTPRRGQRPARRHRRRAPARRRPGRLLRRAPHLRPLLRLHRRADADALPVAARLRHHRSGRRGAARRLGAGHLPRARRRRREAAGRRVAGGLHRRRLRPAHGGARHRAGRRPARARACSSRASARSA